MSGSLDVEGENLKIWDTRSPKIPMFNITAHKDKVFSVDWSKNGVILSGGADAQLNVSCSRL